jgi:hypothetical protein
MATKKKTTAAAPVDVPSALVAEEHNKFLARAKAALAKKWSLTRMESLFDTTHVGWFLVALGRDGEARELMEHVADRVEFSGDYNVWSPVASAIALAARVARKSGDEASRARHVARLVQHPATAIMAGEALKKWIAEAQKDVRSAEVDPSQKWACQGFARGCARAAYFCEMAGESTYDASLIDVAALESTIEEGLAGLRAHLGR